MVSTMKCGNCKHCRPIRGDDGHECGHDAVVGLVMCDICGGWHPVDEFKVQATAKKIQCPDCLGQSDIPKCDGNKLGGTGTPPDWCPGFEGNIKPVQQGQLF